jgi:hypothetical protein
MPDAAIRQRWARARGKRVEDGDVQRAIRPAARGGAQVYPQRVERKPQVLDAKLGGVGHQDAEYGGMQVQVQVAIDVIERQPGGAELSELGVNFLPQLLAQAPVKEVTEAGARRVGGELPLRVYEPGNFCGRQGGMAAEQRQVQSDAQRGILPGQLHRLFESRLVHHQAGGGEDPLFMRPDDRFVD